MKKILAIVLCLVMVLGVAACGGSSASGAAGDKVIKVGVFEPSSGDNGPGGKQEVLGIEYANSLKPTVTLGGEEYKVELVIVDNESSTDKAVSAAQSLVSSGVSVVLGSYGSGVSIAAADIFAEAKLPAIGCSCTNKNVTLGNDYYFRVCFIDPFQGTVMANYVKDQGYNTAYVLMEQGDEYSEGLAKNFVAAFPTLGGTVIEQTFATGTNDFTAVLTEAKNAGADAIFAPSSITSASLLLKQAAEQCPDIAIFAGDTWENSAIIDAAKGTNLKVAFSTFFDENDTSGPASAFVKGFREWLNANSDKKTNNGGNDIVAAVSVLGFDAYNTALAAMEAADAGDSASIYNTLKDPNFSYADAVTGSIAFNEIGDAIKDMAYIKYVDTVNGVFVFDKTQTTADLG